MGLSDEESEKKKIEKDNLEKSLKRLKFLASKKAAERLQKEEIQKLFKQEKANFEKSKAALKAFSSKTIRKTARNVEEKAQHEAEWQTWHAKGGDANAPDAIADLPAAAETTPSATPADKPAPWQEAKAPEYVIVTILVLLSVVPLILIWYNNI
jgi:hypothetical protein